MQLQLRDGGQSLVPGAASILTGSGLEADQDVQELKLKPPSIAILIKNVSF